MNALWFPDRKFTETKDFIFDSIQEDFDQQAELFSGFDLIYTQLTAGKFEGRYFAAHLDHISIQMEYCNQSIEKQVDALPHGFSFTIFLEATTPFYIFGEATSMDSVYLVPPGGEIAAVVPPNGIGLVFVVKRDALIYNDGLISEAADWLTNLDRRGVYIKSKALTTRLRCHIMSALECAGRARTPEARAIIDKATIFTIAYELTMEWWKQGTFSNVQRTASFERFQNARTALLDELHVFDESGLRSLNGLGSRRSIEQAFSKHVFMGPLAYCRVVRLHNVRRKLLERARLNQSIGDIAAEEGFWDWSRFSAHYRKQFGEPPSETRRRLED